jgi:hypothetical protein
LPDYLPWTEADLGAVERAVKRYKSIGLEASAIIEKCGEGIASFSYVDPRTPNAAIVIFEIHKLKRTDTALRAHWVVELQTVTGRRQTLKRHGCVSAGSALFALAKAEKDAQAGFTARDSFDMAANAYWLKL